MRDAVGKSVTHGHRPRSSFRCVTLSRCFSCSVPQFPSVYHGNPTSYTQRLAGIIKYLAQVLAHKGLVSVGSVTRSRSQMIVYRQNTGDLSTIPHMLGFGLTTYSLGLIRPKEDPKFPFYHSKLKKDRNLCWEDPGTRHAFLEGQPKGFSYSEGAILRQSPLRGCRGATSRLLGSRPHRPGLQVLAGDPRLQPAYLGDWAAATSLQYLKASPAECTSSTHNTERRSINVSLSPHTLHPAYKDLGGEEWRGVTGDVLASVCMQIASAD